MQPEVDQIPRTVKPMRPRKSQRGQSARDRGEGQDAEHGACRAELAEAAQKLLGEVQAVHRIVELRGVGSGREDQVKNKGDDGPQAGGTGGLTQGGGGLGALRPLRFQTRGVFFGRLLRALPVAAPLFVNQKHERQSQQGGQGRRPEAVGVGPVLGDIAAQTGGEEQRQQRRRELLNGLNPPYGAGLVADRRP